MTKAASYYVVLDANVWIAERLLQSSIGGALLYALTEAKASIILPEIVELEVNGVLPELAERAVDIIRREVALLRQLSGHNLLLTGPTALAITEGINHRWSELEGLFIRVPFTHEQAKSALNRIIRKAPPSGENNEQFRDCCIWDAAMSAASGRLVHLVTGDAAFYEARKPSSGALASALSEELKTAKRAIQIYPSMREFLASIGKSAASIDEVLIASAILESVTPRACEIVAKRDSFGLRARESHFELGKPHEPNISGYATPKPSLIAVSFEVSFDLERVETRDDTEARSDATLSIKGVCSYDPNSKEVSDIEIREWSQSQRGGNGWGSSFHSSDQSTMERQQFSPSHMRVIYPPPKRKTRKTARIAAAKPNENAPVF